MAKDAGGHGSEAQGLSKQLSQRNAMFGAGVGYRTVKPVTSNAEAGNALMSSLKSTQAPIHDGMMRTGLDYSPPGASRASGGASRGALASNRNLVSQFRG